MSYEFRKPIGLALGSGAARGWSHIGAIRALQEANIEPEIICGSSAGAVVGAFYAADELDALETWILQLTRRQIMSLLDPTLRGGLLKARKIFDVLAEHLPDRAIETLPRPFGVVTTDLATGQEIWLREGSLLRALRATIALPGLVSPEYVDGNWLLDGGLVNPVPVSLCRAMGAQSVIAVDLNSTLLNRSFDVESSDLGSSQPEESEQQDSEATESEQPVLDEPVLEESGSDQYGVGERAARILTSIQEAAGDWREQLGFDDAAVEATGPTVPRIYDVITNSINIMQVRIGRSRMAGDPPEMIVMPRLHDFALLDFNRAAEAIAAGRTAVAQALATR
jgi:NTE family protein